MAAEGQKIMEVSAMKFFFILLLALVISQFAYLGVNDWLNNRKTISA